jgi:hypothetical protein
MMIDAQVPVANVRLVDEGTGLCTLIVRGIPDASVDGPIERRRGPITAGQQRAFAAKARTLDRLTGERGAAAARALEEVAIASRRERVPELEELSAAEANHALDWLEDELRRRETDA